MVSERALRRRVFDKNRCHVTGLLSARQLGEDGASAVAHFDDHVVFPGPATPVLVEVRQAFPSRDVAANQRLHRRGLEDVELVQSQEVHAVLVAEAILHPADAVEGQRLVA
ncbi:MAG: hypothetical protein ACK55I_02605, partial [bacterium]